MQLIAITLVALVGIVFVGGAIYSAVAPPANVGRKKWAVRLGYALIALGGLGFFGLGFSSLGGVRWLLPTTFEWPVGFVRGLLTLPDGMHVVPVDMAGKRIQIYDSDWRFVKGWNVPAGGGGQFTLRLAQSNSFAIITRRPPVEYFYTADGLLVSSQAYAPKAFSDFPASEESGSVPTAWWLWLFTSPLHPWLFGMLGAVVMLLDRPSTNNSSENSKPNPPPVGC